MLKRFGILKSQIGLPILMGILTLTAIVVYRSYILEITNDEAFSFWMVSENKINMLCGTANNHWLNTLFIFIWTKLIGHSEWMLRIHSVIAFVIYSIFTVAVFKHLKNKLLLFIPCCILLCNYYLLDYFSLARGYSISLMFEAMAIYYILREGVKRVFYIYLFLALSVFSNYSSIYILTAYFIIDFYSYFNIEKISRISLLGFFKARYPFLIILTWAVPNILFIKYYTGDLEEGQRNGFISDTIGVFLQRSFSIDLSFEYLNYIYILLIVGFLVVAFLKRNSFHSCIKTLVQLLLVSFLLIEFLYVFLNIPYPYGRTSFFYNYVFYILLIVLLIELIMRLNVYFQYVVSIVVCSLFLYNLVYHLNVNSTIEFWPQQSFRKAYAEIINHEKYTPNSKIGMPLDQFGVYKNYYGYIQPLIYKNPVFVYNSRDGYSHFERKSMYEQDYLLLITPYDKILDSIPSNIKFLLLKKYPLMHTDLMYIQK
jgi:hypothetical protein